MREIKELMQIMLDNVERINSYSEIDSLCSLAFKLEDIGVISSIERNKISNLLYVYVGPLTKQRIWGFYAFQPGLVEPRRELLIKIIKDL